LIRVALLGHREDLPQPLQRHRGLAGLGEHPAELAQRPHHLGQYLQKCEQHADADLPGLHHGRASQQDDTELADDQSLAHRPVVAHGADHPAVEVPEGGVVDPEAGLLLGLVGEGPYHPDTAEVFLQHRGEPTLGLVGGPKQPAQAHEVAVAEQHQRWQQ